MDLGATICRPASPLCERCPLTSACAAQAGGDPAAFPRRTAKGDRPHRHGVVFRLVRGGKVALVRRQAKGLLGGMLGLPTTDWRAASWTQREALAVAPRLSRGGVWRSAGSVEHAFTHFSLTLAVYESSEAADDPALIWMSMAQALADTPSVFRKALSAGMPTTPTPLIKATGGE